MFDRNIGKHSGLSANQVIFAIKKVAGQLNFMFPLLDPSLMCMTARVEFYKSIYVSVGNCLYTPVTVRVTNYIMYKAGIPLLGAPATRDN